MLYMLLFAPTIQGMPSWIKPGLYFQYRIEGRIITNPPFREDLADYYVVGAARFVVTSYNETGMSGYYELQSLNDTKMYFSRILGTPNSRVEGFIKWDTEYNNTRFNIYVDPDTIPDSQKPYESVNTRENLVSYLYIQVTYDKETGVVLEYYYLNEVNETLNYTTYKYILHYKLIDTNLEYLYGRIGKISAISAPPNNQSPDNIYHIDATNYYEESKYPIHYAGVFIILALIIIFTYVLIKSKEKK